jgi:hypothetical protein
MKSKMTAVEYRTGEILRNSTCKSIPVGLILEVGLANHCHRACVVLDPPGKKTKTSVFVLLSLSYIPFKRYAL